MNKIDSLDLRMSLSLSALCIAHGKISLRTIFSKATVLAFLLLSPLFIYGQNYANSYPATDALVSVAALCSLTRLSKSSRV